MIDREQEIGAIRIQQSKGQQKQKQSPPVKTQIKYCGQLLRIIYPYSMLILVSLLLIISSAIIQNIIPYRLSQLINSPEQSKMVSLFELMILNCLLMAIRKYMTKITGEVILIYLRRQCFADFIYNDMRFFNKNKVGVLLTILTTDVQTVKNMFTKTAFQLAKKLSRFITISVILVTLDWRLSIIFMVFLPVHTWLNVKLSKLSKSLSRKYNAALAEAYSFAVQRFRGVLICKAFSKQKDEQIKFREYISKVYQIGLKKSVVASLATSVGILLPNIGTMLVIWFGFFVIEYGESQMQLISSFLMYTVALANTSATVSKKMLKITNGYASVERILDLLSYQVKKIDKPENSQDLMTPNATLRLSQNEISQVSLDTQLVEECPIAFEKVNFSYKVSRGQVLTNFSLRIQDAEYIGIVGPSGSGKSTILKLLLEMYQPTAGKIYCKISKDKIGYVPQEAVIFSGNFLDNINYSGQQLEYQRVKQICSYAGIWQFIESLPNGLNTKLGNKGIKLSGGQKQKIALARALSIRPKLLLLDEATANLDSESEEQIYDLIHRISKEGEITIISISHSLRRANDFHRILVLDQGKVENIGKHEQLLDSCQLYTQLFRLQSLV